MTPEMVSSARRHMLKNDACGPAPEWGMAMSGTTVVIWNRAVRLDASTLFIDRKERSSMKLIRNRRFVALVATVALAVTAVSGYAYWTSGGTGTGTGTTGTSSAINATQTSTVSAMTPGSPAQALDFSLDNTAATNQFVTGVAISIASVTGANISPSHPCDASDFTLVQPTVSYGDLTPGVNPYAPSGASLRMIDKPSDNQDGCKAATVNLSYTVS
jgi:hypothetical protein